MSKAQCPNEEDLKLELWKKLAPMVFPLKATASFIHFTSWDNGRSIILNKELWLNDLSSMTDPEELVDGAFALRDMCRPAKVEARRNLKEAASMIISGGSPGVHVLCGTKSLDSAQHWSYYADRALGVGLELRIGDTAQLFENQWKGLCLVSNVRYTRRSKEFVMKKLVDTVELIYDNKVDMPAGCPSDRWTTVLSEVISKLFFACLALTKTPSHCWERETRLVVLPEPALVDPRPGLDPDFDRPVVKLPIGSGLDLTRVHFRSPPSPTVRLRSLELLRRETELSFEIGS